MAEFAVSDHTGAADLFGGSHSDVIFMLAHSHSSFHPSTGPASADPFMVHLPATGF